MRKIFTFLCAALMSVGMFAATVTWNSSTLSSIDLITGESFTEGGVTLTVLDGKIDGTRKWSGNSPEASFKFSTSLGNFTKIEITAEIRGLEGSGWTQASPGAVWTGEANETTFGIYFRNVTQVVFTIEDPAPTTYTLQLVADPEKGSVAVTNLLGSDIVDNGNGNYTVPENTKVTILATPNEGYVFSGWLEGNVLCDFIDCGTALNTLDNPLTFTLTQDAACKAEFAAVAPQPAATVVTITNNDFPGMDVSFTKDGVTVSADWIDNMQSGNLVAPGSFSTTLGNFTKIEVNAGEIGSLGEGWSGNSERQTWTGNASSVSFSGDISGLGHGITIMCTIEPSGGETAVDNIQIDKAQSTKLIRNGMLLIEKNGKIYNATGAEVK